MADRGILFSAPMIRAILAGTKTQTRRVVKYERAIDGSGREGWHVKPYGLVTAEQMAKKLCPYGAPGDRLWVRETWARNENQLSDSHMDTSLRYAATDERALDNGEPKPWRPSIHMPRSASRITLDVVSVRVERLQDISLSDVRAEGCEVRQFWLFGADDAGRQRIGASVYRALWESINGARILVREPVGVGH